MIWLAIKAIAGRLATFFAANWRWLLPVLAALTLWWYVTHLQTQRDQARAEVARIHQAIQTAAEQRRQDNARKEAQARAAINQILGDHKSIIAKLKGEYDARHKTDAARAADRIDSWRERVRLEVARNAAGLPQVPQPAEGAAQSGGDCDATAARSAYDTLELACAVTTVDYNALRESWDAACAVHGCATAE